MSKAPGTMFLVAAAGLLFWSAAKLQPGLVEQRQAFVPGAVEITESMPPLVAFTTVALGGFRGLIADALWLRSTRMQEEGRYFELVQLADWITKLEPRFTPVWAFHGWNMAYNVSVLFDEPEDRWRWVQAGIRLLRDEGIPNNPGQPQLYWELAWLYQHKMGQNMDLAHHYYKTQLAAEMGRLFDGRAPDFERMGQAARTREDLLKRPGVAALLDAGAAAEIDMFNLSELASIAVPEDLFTRLHETRPGQELLAHLQRRTLEKAYRLDPEFMQKVDAAHGPLDWRLPQAHAIYWAQQGLPHASGFKKVQLERMTFQGMADAFRQGHAFYDIEGTLIPSPNLDILPRVRQTYEQAIEENPKEKTFGTAHYNFLNEAMGILYAYHHTGKARDLFNDIQTRYPDKVGGKSFNTYLVEQVAQDVKDLTDSQAGAYVEGLWVQSYLWYAMGDDDRSAGSAALAKMVYTSYQSSLSPGEHVERVGLPEQALIRDRAYHRLMMEMPTGPARTRLQQLRPSAETEKPDQGR